MKEQNNLDFIKAVEFHGHSCPGLAIGYRVALLAAERFKDRAMDEELVAIVENNSCEVDAIQAINGCTFGKGNLIYRDYGKNVYTFLKRGDKKGICISLKSQPYSSGSRMLELFKKMRDDSATDEEISEFGSLNEQETQQILDAPGKDMFEIKEVTIEHPEKAQIYTSITCSKCNKEFMETRARIKNGKILCIPCFEEAND